MRLAGGQQATLPGSVSAVSGRRHPWRVSAVSGRAADVAECQGVSECQECQGVSGVSGMSLSGREMACVDVQSCWIMSCRLDSDTPSWRVDVRGSDTPGEGTCAGWTPLKNGNP